MTPKKFISIAEFCAIYKTGRTKTYTLLAEGELAAVKRGRSTLIEVGSAERWAASLPRMQSRMALPERLPSSGAPAPARASEAKS